jgi:DNA-binding beta-propeller fold protein YncE
VKHRTPAACLVALVVAAPAICQALLSAPPLELARSIPLEKVHGRMDHMAVDRAGGLLFVPALENNTLEIVDLAKGTPSRRIEGLIGPQGACALPSGRIVVASSADGTCRIFDESLKPAGTIEGLVDADGVRFDPVGGRVYVGYGSGALAVIDPEKATLVATIPLDGHPESFQLESKGKRIFVNVPQAKHVAVIDREKNAVVAKWPLRGVEGNYPMAVDEAGRRLFVACRKPAKLVILDVDSGRQVTALDCVEDADDLFWDELRRRIYVSGGQGMLGVFEKYMRDQWSLLATKAIPHGARTCLFSPAAGRLWLAVPRRQDQRCEIQEYLAP